MDEKILRFGALSRAVAHILLIEDNPIDARLMQRFLGAVAGWAVNTTWIDDGQKALWYLQALENGGVSEPPVLVLLDLNLPKYNGLEVLEAFRNSTSAAKMPVFLVSSEPSSQIEEMTKSRGLRANGYFEKPLGLAGFELLAQSIRTSVNSNFLEARTVAA